jgi:hypothetical protein
MLGCVDNAMIFIDRKDIGRSAEELRSVITKMYTGGVTNVLLIFG